MDRRPEPENPGLCVGDVFQGPPIAAAPAGESSIFQASIGKAGGSNKASTEALPVDTVDGVPNVGKRSLPFVAFCSLFAAESTDTGWTKGLAVVALAVDAAEWPSSSCSPFSEYLELDSPLLSIFFTDASCALHGLELSDMMYPIADFELM